MDAFAKNLKALLEEKSISFSRITPNQKKQHQSLFDNEILGTKRVGSGKRYVILDQVNLKRYIDSQYPSGLDLAIEGANSRAESVAIHGDAKRKNKPDREPLLIKAISDKQNTVTFNDSILPVLEWCHFAGTDEEVQVNEFVLSGNVFIAIESG